MMKSTLGLLVLLTSVSGLAYQPQQGTEQSGTVAIGERVGGIGVVLGDFDTVTGIAVVQKVLPNSPAEKIGVKEYDRVLRVNGNTFHEFVGIIQAIRGNVGETVFLTLQRDGSEFTLAPVRELLEIS